MVASQAAFFGQPDPDTLYKKSNAPSKTTTESTSSSTRNGVKTTKTKTITTERFPVDKPDEDTYTVSEETIRIDDYTEDQITKTTKILGGMQYDITTKIRSVCSQPIGMPTATGGKTWASETPSPRNMPGTSAPVVSKPLEYKSVPAPQVPGAPAPAPAAPAPGPHPIAVAQAAAATAASASGSGSGGTGAGEGAGTSAGSGTGTGTGTTPGSGGGGTTSGSANGTVPSTAAAATPATSPATSEVNQGGGCCIIL